MVDSERRFEYINDTLAASGISDKIYNDHFCELQSFYDKMISLPKILREIKEAKPIPSADLIDIFS
ncbi:hypothetical protein EHO98_22820 [Leptospira stimsonii]|uniref:Uncharacterized protein n=1 Tax=Leptospira stimsonii TaxID=2202203 RepID=A0ABY2N592_9LEPT|nr:hypothetical protein EHO98_22820 [Leptospira stimsonii]TGM17278.1 hypothetical protein EHQ90_07645 [Leptospira stimsonii]